MSVAAIVAIETIYTLIATLSCDQVCTDGQLLLSIPPPVAPDTAVEDKFQDETV
ncbi:hypothetical protein NJ7G_3650 [Natrinema sp. J7-2]|uniref:Uncharacterized protein n=1 Tax=Natrinema gari JCM 14663 TaxID=1230459 RepID=L9YSJ3_9EURY|nr:hypothetical protein NJ7G_3650 [Natrinema sp. J7-2]ELY77079.1 hypothetical protein C486_16550 [Natrinema gari JCM 14663]